MSKRVYYQGKYMSESSYRRRVTGHKTYHFRGKNGNRTVMKVLKLPNETQVHKEQNIRTKYGVRRVTTHIRYKPVKKPKPPFRPGSGVWMHVRYK